MSDNAKNTQTEHQSTQTEEAALGDLQLDDDAADDVKGGSRGVVKA